MDRKAMDRSLQTYIQAYIKPIYMIHKYIFTNIHIYMHMFIYTCIERWTDF